MFEEDFSLVDSVISEIIILLRKFSSNIMLF
jgi:hypothetical protein